MLIYIQLMLTQILQGEKIQSLVYVASSAEDSDFIFGAALFFLPFFVCYRLLLIAKTKKGLNAPLFTFFSSTLMLN